MAVGDASRFGEQPLAQTVAAAGALRRLAGQLLSLEHPHAAVDVMLGQLGGRPGRLGNAWFSEGNRPPAEVIACQRLASSTRPTLAAPGDATLSPSAPPPAPA